MSIRVAINGFGRMGRLSLRAAWAFDPSILSSWEHPNGPWGEGVYDIVHINEISGPVETAAHLLGFDSVHGRWQVTPSVDGNFIRMGKKQISYSDGLKPADVEWKKHGIDLVVEATGKFKTAKDVKTLIDAFS